MPRGPWPTRNVAAALVAPSMTVTLWPKLFVTYILFVVGFTARALQLLPVRTVATTVLAAPSITVTEFSPELATYTRLVSGLTAMASGPAPVLMVAMAVRVFPSMTATELLLWLTT